MYNCIYLPTKILRKCANNALTVIVNLLCEQIGFIQEQYECDFGKVRIRAHRTEQIHRFEQAILKNGFFQSCSIFQKFRFQSMKNFNRKIPQNVGGKKLAVL